MQITAPRAADRVAFLAHELASQKSRFDPGGQLQSLEWRVALCRCGLARPHGPGLSWIDEREARVQTLRDVAFGIAAEPPRGIRAGQGRDAVEREPAPRALRD